MVAWSFTYYLVLLFISLSDTCIPTRSPDDLMTTSTTTTVVTTSTTAVATTTTTTSGNCITNCPNIESCVGGPGGDIPPGAASCFMSTAMVTKTATGCAFTVDCNSIVPGLPLTAWYKQQSTNMWVNYGSNLMMATCGDTPNNQWKDPMGNVVIKLVCAD